MTILKFDGKMGDFYKLDQGREGLVTILFMRCLNRHKLYLRSLKNEQGGDFCHVD